MADAFVAEQSLACDMIELHGLDAATVARNNARGAALAGQAARQAKSWIRVLSGSSSEPWLAEHHRSGRRATAPRRVDYDCGVSTIGSVLITTIQLRLQYLCGLFARTSI